MHVIRMFFGAVDLSYIYMVGLQASPNKFEPMVATDSLHYAIAMLNAFNGGKMPDDISPWMNVMQPQEATETGEVKPAPGDFKRGKLPPEVLAALQAETNKEQAINDMDIHDRGRHRQSSPAVE